MTQTRATAIGFTAILLWSLLAVLTVKAAPVPPFQLTAMCFLTGGLIGLIWTAKTGGFTRLRHVNWRIYTFGTAGLFGYHFLYFSALRRAPAAEAGLIAYLWPLLIVLLSGFLPNERLLKGHIAGAIISFAGAAIIILHGSTGFQAQAMSGYALAGLCAITWAAYSVISRRLGNIPTSSVAVFCLATAALSTGAHFALETTIWPQTTIGWLACLALGVGPVGLAFYVWDFGVKHGNIQLLGVASYAAPLLSTFILVLAGAATPSWALWVAAVLITSGAALAAKSSR
ncbi:MAG: EamA family transporter [Rhodobacterales bacterium]|nr:MAG: EamA family transporter [Rhodobacterales bacterium]